MIDSGGPFLAALLAERLVAQDPPREDNFIAPRRGSFFSWIAFVDFPQTPVPDLVRLSVVTATPAQVARFSFFGSPRSSHLGLSSMPPFFDVDTALLTMVLSYRSSLLGLLHCVSISSFPRSSEIPCPRSFLRCLLWPCDCPTKPPLRLPPLGQRSPVDDEGCNRALDFNH